MIFNCLSREEKQSWLGKFGKLEKCKYSLIFLLMGIKAKTLCQSDFFGVNFGEYERSFNFVMYGETFQTEQIGRR
jgi:hypothetical protein